MDDELNRMFVVSLFERRAAYKVYKTFRVNRFELWLLMAMLAVLALTGKKSAGKREIFDMVTGNTKAKSKFEGYWAGLKTRELIRSVTLKNGVETWVITPLALKCIYMFEAELKRIEIGEKKRQSARQASYKPIIKPYPLNDLPPTVIEDLGAHYKSLN